MALGIIGRKIGMTQVYEEDGTIVPVTIVEAGPCAVVQIKTTEKDGYNALQLGFADCKEKSLTKAQQGHLKKAEIGLKKFLKEFRLTDTAEYKLGQQLKVDMFQKLDYVDVTGTSIGKGFQGGMKRWHWSGGPDTHGSMSHRAPGSIGASASPSRVFKGQHLPGHMGCEKITVQNIEVVEVDGENNLIALKGSIPGHKGAIVSITKAKKKDKRILKTPEELAAIKGSGAKKTIKKKK